MFQEPTVDVRPQADGHENQSDLGRLMADVESCLNALDGHQEKCKKLLGVTCPSIPPVKVKSTGVVRLIEEIS